MSCKRDASSKKTDGKTLYLTRLALITAIMIIMSFTPLGYFRTPFLSITLMTVPVVIGGVLFGPLAGAYCGLVFGITSVINAVAAGGLTGMLLLINPLGALFMLLIPRILEGYLSALVFLFFKKHRAVRTGVFLSSLICPVLNTALFMCCLILIFFNTDYIQDLVSSLGAANPLMFVIAFVGVQGVIEAVICFLLASLISLALLNVAKR